MKIPKRFTIVFGQNSRRYKQARFDPHPPIDAGIRGRGPPGVMPTLCSDRAKTAADAGHTRIWWTNQSAMQPPQMVIGRTPMVSQNQAPSGADSAPLFRRTLL